MVSRYEGHGKLAALHKIFEKNGGTTNFLYDNFHLLKYKFWDLTPGLTKPAKSLLF